MEHNRNTMYIMLSIVGLICASCIGIIGGMILGPIILFKKVGMGELFKKGKKENKKSESQYYNTDDIDELISRNID